MKVLVFDDDPIHRLSAEFTLSDYDLTVVGTYDEAEKLLVPEYDYELRRAELKRLLREARLPEDYNPYREEGASKEDEKKYDELEEMASKLATTYPVFDVVMTDLFVPASERAQGGAGLQHVGQQMPLGTTIALLALAVGIKKVAVVTDMNHHHHPASAAFDNFVSSSRYKRLKDLPIKIVCSNHSGHVLIDVETKKRITKEEWESADFDQKYPFVDGNLGDRHGLSVGKDWGMILKELLS